MLTLSKMIDLYTRKVGAKPQSAANVSHDKFLPKFWTPEEDIHIQKIKLGSQRRPWYKKMQGFRCVRNVAFYKVANYKEYYFHISCLNLCYRITAC